MAITQLDLLGGGGGAPSYLSGAEVGHADLAGGTLTLALGDMEKTHLLTSNADGAIVKLPDATTFSAVGKGVGARVLRGSRPIRFINAGTAGTDPILEAFALPGADFALLNTSTAAARGDWRSGMRSNGLFHGIVPVSIPTSFDAGVDFGSTVNIGNMETLTIGTNLNLVRLSSTLYVAIAMTGAQTATVAYAITYNHSTNAWTWGSPTTLISTVGTQSVPRVIALSATQFAVIVWDNTASVARANLGTISGTTITAGTAIVSGAWGVNPSNQSCTEQCSLVLDAAANGSFWFASRYSSTSNALGVIQFGISGSNLVQNGGASFNVLASINTIGNFGGFSPAANTLDMAMSTSGTSPGFSRFVISGSSVTNSANVLLRGGGTQVFAGNLTVIDPTNHVYLFEGLQSAIQMMGRAVLTSGFTDTVEERMGLAPTCLHNSTNPISTGGGQMLPISDDEFLAFNSSVLGLGDQGGFALFSPWLIRARALDSTAFSTSDSGGQFRLMCAPLFSGPMINRSTGGVLLGFNLNASIRRAAIQYCDQTQSLSINRHMALQMYDLPRNYDKVFS